MKKIFLLLMIIVSTICLSSCSDKVIAKENGVTMTLTDEWKNVITYNGTIPSCTFEYDGIFNVYETSSDIGYIFTKNDNYLLSDAFSNHFETKIKDNYIITSKIFQELDSDGALFGNRELIIDEGTQSYEYTVVAWDETGTRYSYMYRSFVSHGKTYYAYTYNTGITMNIEVPLMAQIVDGEQKVYMINLPYNTIYKVNVSTKAKSLLNKEEYLKEEYHTFQYPTYLTDSTDKAEGVRNWYIKYCDGRYEGDKFVYTYIGIDYVVEFFETTFTIYVK